MNFTVQTKNETAKIEISELYEKNGVKFFDVTYSTPEEQVPQPFKVLFDLPDVDCYSVFSPMIFREKHHKGPNWGKRVTTSRLASGMPVHQLLSADGKNRYTFAIDDAKTPTSIGTGTHEETARVFVAIEFFSQPTAPIKSYKATVRFDDRDIPYYDSIYDTTAWWENECGYTPAYVPEHARLPMNSLWYSFHQKLDPDEIVKQCELSKPLGMDTVIVDDGWQCADNNRGYAYCGDWEVCEEKIPDMKNLVDRVHETGMKFMLWYSVPWMGKFSKNYERFSTMLLDGNYTDRWAALDPRYKEVRDFIVGIYKNAVLDWGLDGLKLDFIDSFKLAGKSLEYDERRDISSLEEAVDTLMKEVADTLTAINPDILIEFRQTYVGPTIRKYGNMMRVFDCPADAIRNRTESVSLRYTCGKTAVHSDMLMWNYDDTVEAAAMQFVGALYTVPQVSVLIDKLSDEHYKMVKYYLSFWREHREILIDGKLTANNPESMYSSITSALDSKAVVTLYADRVIDTVYDYLVAVNATPKDTIFVKGYNGREYTVVNCMGEEVATGKITADIFEIAVPMCGMVTIK